MVIGITGSIASGKSLVTNYLITRGYRVIDCDKISHDVLLIEEVKEKLVNEFNDLIIKDSEIDRKQLGKIIFNSDIKKQQLQNIVFPYILKEIKHQLSLDTSVVFLDAPLLFEYNIEYLVDKIIVVKCNRDIQIARLMQRDNISKEYALKKINSQLPIEEKEKYADYIINNSYDIDNTENQINIILKELEN